MEDHYLFQVGEWVASPFEWIHYTQIDELMKQAGLFRYEYLDKWHWGFIKEKVNITQNGETKDAWLPIRFYNFQLSLLKARYNKKRNDNSTEVIQEAIQTMKTKYCNKYLPTEHLPETGMEGDNYSYIYREFERLYKKF